MSAVAAKRLAEKHDTDRGLTPMQKKTAEQFEREVKGNDYETAAVVTRDGKIYVGGKGSAGETHIPTTVPEEERRGAIITHNHPFFTNSKSLASRVGLPISAQDMQTAVGAGYDGIRARTKNGMYTISGLNKLVEKEYAKWRRGKKDWLKENQRALSRNPMFYPRQRLDSIRLSQEFLRSSPDFIKKQIRRGLAEKIYDKMDSRMRQLVSQNLGYANRTHDETRLTRVERANVAMQNRAMKEIAKEYGLRFRWKPIRD